MTERDLLISFKLHLNDKIKSQQNIIKVIDKHLTGEDPITDNIVKSILILCKKNGIDFDSVVFHSERMYENDI